MQSQGETDLRRKMICSLGMEMLGGVQPLPHAESDRDGDMELETQGAFWADRVGALKEVVVRVEPIQVTEGWACYRHVTAILQSGTGEAFHEKHKEKKKEKQGESGIMKDKKRTYIQ